jgi:hypothetical protein
MVSGQRASQLGALRAVAHQHQLRTRLDAADRLRSSA